MKPVRYAVSFLLLAAAACVHAQPYVRINSASQATECDVKNPPAGEPIFRLDTQGNVLINGTLSGNGCGGSGGGSGTPNATFTPFSTAPAPIAASPNSIVAGTGASTITYAAAYATDCSVTSSAGTVNGSGTCPSLTVTNSTCTGSGSPLICAKSNGSATEPTALGTGVNSCSYTLTATCNPGAVTSTTNLTVTPAGSGGGGGGGMPAACTGSGAVADIGLVWQKSTTMVWLPGQSSNPISDATDYTRVYSPPTGSPQPWPSGSSGVKPTVSIGKNNYLGLGFTVPASASGIAADYFNVLSASQPVALTISECPGDFGQQGTHITNNFCKCDRTGCGGLVGYVGVTPGTCPLVVGKTYYLNMLDAPLPPANSTITPTSACLGGSCNAQVELTY